MLKQTFSCATGLLKLEGVFSHMEMAGADSTSGPNIPETETSGCGCVVQRWGWESWELRLQCDRCAIKTETCVP